MLSANEKQQLQSDDREREDIADIAYIFIHVVMSSNDHAQCLALFTHRRTYVA